MPDEEEMMAVFSDPFNALSNFQQAPDAFRASSWLDAGPSGGGAYPPMNVFRKGDGPNASVVSTPTARPPSSRRRGRPRGGRPR